MRRPIVTKRSTANANTEKSIPPAMSQRNQHLTHAMLRMPATTTPKQRPGPPPSYEGGGPGMPKQFQTTWCFGKVWQHAGGAGDLQSATVFPGILPFRYTTLAKVLLFGKAAQFFAKKVTATISLSGP